MSAADVATLRDRYAAMGDKEYAAVAVLLGQEWVARRLAGHATDTGLDWTSILQVAWSSGERVVLEAAYALFRSEGFVDLGYVASMLDDENYTLVLRMMDARRTGRIDMPARPRPDVTAALDQADPRTTRIYDGQ